jgi:hypothetical protein
MTRPGLTGAASSSDELSESESESESGLEEELEELEELEDSESEDSELELDEASVTPAFHLLSRMSEVVASVFLLREASLTKALLDDDNPCLTK